MATKKASIVPYDIIIVGAGPAGITSAIYLARKKLDILVLTENIGGQAALSSTIDNWVGYKLITGPELVKKFEEHMKAFKVVQAFGKATEIGKAKDLFFVRTDEKTYFAKSLILTAGKRPIPLNIPGEKKYMAKGVTYCAICDSPVFRNLPVVVVGGGNSALDAILQLSSFTKKIYVVNNGQSLGGEELMRDRVSKLPYVKVFNGSRLSAIKGDKFVKSVDVENRATKEKFSLNVRGVFVEIGLFPGTEIILPKDIKLNTKKEVITDKSCRTSVEGIFAAGDITDVGYKQIIIAAGEGAVAALSAYDYLKGKKEFLEEKFK
jgi:alkyl hydroperoxide reductase subunit F